MVSGTNTFANLIFPPPSCSSSFVGLVLLSALSLESWKSLCGDFRCWFTVTLSKSSSKRGLGILWWCHAQLVCLTDLGSSCAVRLRCRFLSWFSCSGAGKWVEQILASALWWPCVQFTVVLVLSLGEGSVCLTKQLPAAALGSRGGAAVWTQYFLMCQTTLISKVWDKAVPSAPPVAAWFSRRTPHQSCQNMCPFLFPNSPELKMLLESSRWPIKS